MIQRAHSKIFPASTPHTEHGDDVEDHHFNLPEYLVVQKDIKKLKVVAASSPESGHLIPLAQVAFELARRGHDVKLVTCDFAISKLADKAKKVGCELVGFAKTMESADTGKGRAYELKNLSEDMMAMFGYYEDEMGKEAKAFLTQEKPDVVVADFITTSFIKTAKELNLPLAINWPGPLPMITMLQGGAWVRPLLGMTTALMVKEARAYVKELALTLLDIVHTDLIMLHTFFGLDQPVPISPNIVVTGSVAPRVSGTVEATSSDALNEWVAWVQGQGMKIVYVTMGSMQVLTEKQVQGLYEGLAQVEGCAIAWSLKDNQQQFLPVPGGIEKLPKKFYVNKWFPQAEVLQLSQVKVVITHCGWGGLNETICAGKPIVATPFRADQPGNAKLLAKAGAAFQVDTKKMAPAEIAKAVRTVLAEPQYGEKARQLQQVLLKTGGATRCAEAVEDLAANGVKELSSTPPSSVALYARLGCKCCLFGTALYGLGISFGLWGPTAKAGSVMSKLAFWK